MVKVTKHKLKVCKSENYIFFDSNLTCVNYVIATKTTCASTNFLLKKKLLMNTYNL